MTSMQLQWSSVTFDIFGIQLLHNPHDWQQRVQHFQRLSVAKEESSNQGLSRSTRTKH